MIYRREGMRHQCWSLVIVSTERGRQVGDEVLHHGLPRSRESPVYRRGHGESVFACASTLVRRGEYRAQTGIWRLLGFVSAGTIKGRSSSAASKQIKVDGRKADESTIEALLTPAHCGSRTVLRRSDLHANALDKYLDALGHAKAECCFLQNE